MGGCKGMGQVSKRRTKGEGSIFWSKSEATWIAKITLPDGREKRKRNKDKQVVQDWLFEQRKAIQEYRALPDENMTFAVFVDKFLEDVAKHTLKPKTYPSYEWILKKHVIANGVKQSVEYRHIPFTFANSINYF